METTIKQAEEDRNRCLDNAKKMYEEFKPLKDDIDHMRNLMGMEKLPSLNEDEEKLTPELVFFIIYFKYIYNFHHFRIALKFFLKLSI